MSGIPSWAVRGAKVVCVKSGGWKQVNDLPPPPDGFQWPVFGSVYTITEVTAEAGQAWLVLAECGDDDEFFIGRFRPVSKRTVEQDIAEHFSDLLKVDAPEGVSA